MTTTFTVTTTLTAEQIDDVLTSALEGGSNYWADVVGKIEPTSWEYVDTSLPREDGNHWMQEYPLNPGGALLIQDLEDEVSPAWCLDSKSIQAGLAAMAEKCPTHLADIVIDNYDANTADAFLQCCLFGDIIYA